MQAQRPACTLKLAQAEIAELLFEPINKPEERIFAVEFSDVLGLPRRRLAHPSSAAAATCACFPLLVVRSGLRRVRLRGETCHRRPARKAPNCRLPTF